jgi:hypothetical protein
MTPLYRLVCDTYKAMNNLRLHVHYLSCDGAGRPSSVGAVTLSAINYKRVRGANDRVGVGFIGYGLIGKRHVARLRPRLGSFAQFGD